MYLTLLFSDIDVFYGGVPQEEILIGNSQVLEDFYTSPDPKFDRLSIHHWAKHSICGRGVLLDVEKFAKEIGGLDNFDPMGGFSLTVEQLEKCAKLQGVNFRTADILVVRYGFIKVLLFVYPSWQIIKGLFTAIHGSFYRGP